MKINENLIELNNNNQFSVVQNKINEYKKNNPNVVVSSLGIGDVSKPVDRLVIKQMKKACDDMGKMKTFKGYGGTYGYEFLKNKILENEYTKLGFTSEEIYISNGTKTDCINILELFDIDSKILIMNPMYPIYYNGAKCLNRNVDQINVDEKDDFKLKVPNKKYDIIYICAPSNPIGIAYTFDNLKEIIDYAIKNNCIILYDNVYESFITSGNVPHSIYEIEGAKKVAIEFRSFSKKASFTGVRCSYYVIPNMINSNVNSVWRERTINRFNGTSYIVQKGAEAVYLPKVQRRIKKDILYYKENSRLLLDCFNDLGFKVWGGIDSPYIWVKIKENLSSWEIFDLYLKKLNVIIIPGIIFGDNSDNYFRVSSLGNRKEIKVAIRRIKEYYEKEN